MLKHRWKWTTRLLANMAFRTRDAASTSSSPLPQPRPSLLPGLLQRFRLVWPRPSALGCSVWRRWTLALMAERRYRHRVFACLAVFATYQPSLTAWVKMGEAWCEVGLNHLLTCTGGGQLTSLRERRGHWQLFFFVGVSAVNETHPLASF